MESLAELEALPSLEAVEAELQERSLLDFIPRISPRYMRPVHLAPLLERFERAIDGESQFICCSAPPRHAKTESVLHVPAYGLRRKPELRFSYSTYADRLSRSKSRKARALAEAAGVRLESKSLNEWRTAEGGGLLAGGVGGPLTGHGVDILLVDDPIKNRVDAESKTRRETLLDWWRDVASTRIEPGGSAFVFMTRWTEDDLIGVLVEEGFTYINLPALSDEGLPLWPQRWPADALEKRKKLVGAYTWASLYQGNPRPRGGAVFNDVRTYREAPVAFSSAFGLDLAYSAKTKSDWSVAVEMAKSGDKFYVLDVHRKQVRAPVFKKLCRKLHRRNRNAPWRWYAPGPEQGVADLFRDGERPVPIRAIAPKGDKFVRAIDYAAAWNDGRVLLPKAAPWLDVFVKEHAAFTGQDDDHDDCVDAAVAAFDELNSGVADTEVWEKVRKAERQGLAAMDL